MKKNLILACSVLLLLYLPPPALPGRSAARAEEAAVVSPSPAALLPIPAQTPPDDPAAGAETAGSPARTLRVLAEGEVLTLSLEDYLAGVLAAEMPVSFPEEALKAQAVAARSYALYCAGSGKHPEADVCADPACCQAWLDEDRLRDVWGGDYEANLARLCRAVEETAGETLVYGGEPILAAFHSSSAGATEDCGAVWSPRPYLVSVSSPETAGDVPGYRSILRCAPLDFRDVILSAHPEADFSGREEDWIGVVRPDPSGRVESAELGGVAIPGTELRRLFSLRSTAFTLEYTDGFFVFTVTGYGHGVGMSQYGAMVMARDGADYREILAHYYPGTELLG